MSEQTLGYDPVSGFQRRSHGGYIGAVNSPADAERVDLAIAALTHGTDRALPDEGVADHVPVRVYLDNVLVELARYRAALARDAAAKEAEREREEAVERKARELSQRWHEVESGHGRVWETTHEGYKQGWRAVARHVLADAAQGEGVAR
jgi:hypothetical protein